VSEQAYVQEYFQQVRKPAGSSTAAPKKAAQSPAATPPTKP
jgi:hypothetical protein